MAVNIGSVVVDLAAQVAEFRKDMGKAADAVSSSAAAMNRSLAGIERRFDTAAGFADKFVKGFLAFKGAEAAVGALERVVSKALDTAASLKDAADKTGIAVVKLQELRFAAQRSNVDIAALDTALKQFAIRVGQAAAGQKDAADELKRAGVAVADSRGRWRGLGDQLGDVADKVKGARSEQQAAAIATAAFGKAGADLVPLLKEGRAGIKALGDEAQRLGLVLDEGAVMKGAAAKDALEDLGRVLTATATRAVLEHADAIKGLAAQLTAAVPRAIEMASAVGQYLGLLDKTPATRVREVEADLAALRAKRAQVLAQIQKDIDAQRKNLGTDAALPGSRLDNLQKEYADTAARFDAMAATLEESRRGWAMGAAVIEDYGSTVETTTAKIAPAVEAVAKHIEKFDDLPLAIQELALEFAEFDKALGKSMEAVEDFRRADEKTAQSLLERGLPALQKYQNALAELDRLRANGMIDDAAWARGFADAGKAYLEASRQAEGLAAQGEKLSDVGRDLGLVFQSAFEDAIVAGESFAAVLDGLFADIKRILARKLITEPLGEAVSDLGSSLLRGVSAGARAGANPAAGGGGIDFGGTISGVFDRIWSGTPVSTGGLGGDQVAVVGGLSNMTALQGVGLGVTAGNIGGGLLNSLVGGQGGQVGSMIGSLAGAGIGFAIGGPFGAALGGLLGGSAGGLFSGLIGGKPSRGPVPSALVSLSEQAGNRFPVVAGKTFNFSYAADNGGSIADAKALGEQTVGILESLVEAFGIGIDRARGDLVGQIENVVDPKQGSGATAGFRVLVNNRLIEEGLGDLAQASGTLIAEMLKEGVATGVLKAEPDIESAIRNTTANTVEGVVADLEFAKGFRTLFDAEEVGTFEAAMAALDTTFAAAKAKAEDLGLAVGDMAASFEAAQRRTREGFLDTFLRDLEALSGRGYINTLRDVAKGFGAAMDEAAAIGETFTDWIRLDFVAKAKAAVEGLDAETILGAIREFSRPDIANAAIVIEGLNAALADLGGTAAETAGRLAEAARMNGDATVRWLRATGASQAAALMAFDLAADEERARAREVGADLALIERTLAAERLAIVEGFAAEAVAAERARAERIADATRSVRDYLSGLASSIADFVAGVRAGPESSLPPLARLAQAQSDFAAQLAAARAGDRNALGAVTGYAGRAIDATRAVFAGTQPGLIEQILQQLEALPSQVSEAELIRQEVERQGLATVAAIETLALTAAASLADVVLAVDANGTGGIDWAEFEAAFAGIAEHQRKLEALIGDPALFAGGDLRAIFDALDANGDAVVTRLELLTTAVDNLALAVDADLSGGIDLAEFRTYFEDNLAHQARLETLIGSPGLFAGGELADIFAALDVNGDSTVSRLELIHAATSDTAVKVGTSAAMLEAVNDNAITIADNIHAAAYAQLQGQAQMTGTLVQALGDSASAIGSSVHAAAYAQLQSQSGFADRIVSAIVALPHAAGGPAAGLTLVGEQGPELVRLPMGSHVIANDDTMAILERLGGDGAARGRAAASGATEALLRALIDESVETRRILERALRAPGRAKVA